MLAYPAYTIEKIEAELSWRQINELVTYWEKHPPVHMRINKIEKGFMLHIKKQSGIEFKEIKKANNDKELIQGLQSIGIL